MQVAYGCVMINFLWILTVLTLQARANGACGCYDRCELLLSERLRGLRSCRSDLGARHAQSESRRALPEDLVISQELAKVGRRCQLWWPELSLAPLRAA